MNCTNGPWFIGQSLDGRNAIIGDVDSVVAYLPGGEDGCTYKVDDAKRIAATLLLIEALRIAVRQNSHDMLMTGEELRICESALARVGGAK